MKLSEAIRAGAKIRPQAFGSLEQTEIVTERVGWFKQRLRREKRTCALGAAFEAQSCGSHTETHYGEPEKSFRGGRQITKGQQVTVIENPTEWNEVFQALTICPQCGQEDDGKRTITHLNDHHKWTREEIAQWVERVENGSLGAVKPLRYWDGDGTDTAPFRQRYAHGPLDNVSTQLLYVRLQIVSTMKAMFPHLGTCGRCDWPWAVVEGHCTDYSAGGGCFPLCEDCWRDLRTPENRMPYYMQLVDLWEKSSPEDGYDEKRESIRKAVLAEGQERDEVLESSLVFTDV